MSSKCLSKWSANAPLGAPVTGHRMSFPTMSFHAQVKRWPSKVGPYRVTRTMGSTVSAVLSSAFKLQVGTREATRWRWELGVARHGWLVDDVEGWWLMIDWCWLVLMLLLVVVDDDDDCWLLIIDVYDWWWQCSWLLLMNMVNTLLIVL